MPNGNHYVDVSRDQLWQVAAFGSDTKLLLGFSRGYENSL